MERRKKGAKDIVLLIFDSVTEPPRGNWITLLWKAFSQQEDANVISIPKLVEENARELKDKYLKLLYALSNSKKGSLNLIDRFQIRSGFSYWWMTQIATKSYTRPKAPYEVVKLLAFEKFVRGVSFNQIRLISSDKALIKTFRNWSWNLGIDFKWESPRGKGDFTSKNYPLKMRIYKFLPYPIRGFAWLGNYLFKRRSFLLMKKSKSIASDSEMMLVDYSDNIDKQALEKNIFVSYYWTDLIMALNKFNVAQNWIHIYVPDKVLSTPRMAADTFSRIKGAGKNVIKHSIMEEWLNTAVVLKTIKDYFVIASRAWLIRKSRVYFLPGESAFNFWEVFKDNWKDSFYGQDAISNLLLLNLFEKIMEEKPPQKIGIYLQENQGWEMALIYAWKSKGHGTLIGVPHSTVRFWDLRYFFDHRHFSNAIANGLPRPDLVALNGPVSKKLYVDSGYPVKEVVDVEALRYLNSQNKVDCLKKKEPQQEIRLLVLGGYLLGETKKQMDWLLQVSENNDFEINLAITFKPHPNCPLDLTKYRQLNIKVEQAPINELIKDFNLAYTSNITSAALDVYLANVPLISMLDPERFNMSPLKGFGNVYFVTSPTELALAIKQSLNYTREGKKVEYFNLDSELPMWRYLIEKYLHKENDAFKTFEIN